MLKVRLEQFEGPLDLLLKLIRNEKLDITEISLVKISDQYLAYIEKAENLSADEVADFLLVAAKLIFLKSKVLLPQQNEELEEDELIKQLKIYQEYLDASKNIAHIVKRGRFFFTRCKNTKEQIFFNPPRKITKNSLAIVFKDFLDNLRQMKTEFEESRLVKKISIQEKISQILNLIGQKRLLTLNQIFSSAISKNEKVVSFLAVLELIKQKSIIVHQEELFAEILIRNYKLGTMESGITASL